MRCEFNDPQCNEEATNKMRLVYGSMNVFQTPLRIGDRTPGKVAVCRKHREHLMTDSEIRYADEGELTNEDIKFFIKNPINKSKANASEDEVRD